MWGPEKIISRGGPKIPGDLEILGGPRELDYTMVFEENPGTTERGRTSNTDMSQGSVKIYRKFLSDMVGVVRSFTFK